MAQPSHGLAMHGDLKYPADFKHFDYVNPDAPKGGLVRLAGRGGFDTFNQYVVKGRPSAGIGLIFESLLVSSADEPFSMYGLLAETVETPEDRSWVAFTLRKDARWHDGKPITVDDVIWTFQTLKAKGRPFFRYYYANVQDPVRTGERTVKFSFTGGVNRELPLIVGQLPVLPKHYWEGRDFEAALLEPPLGSGPYRVVDFEPNRHVVYERVEDYWGAKHPTQVGFSNFQQIRYDYYRDDTIIIEAFKSGAFDYRAENSSKAWATAYDVPALREGMIEKKTFEHNRVAPAQGFVMNQRRAKFGDPRVRQALSYAFDFEWSNKALFYGQYVRTRSYFDNSELSSTEVPKGDVLALLEKYRGRIPDEVFTKSFEPPKTDGSGNLRRNLRAALKLLKEAGWEVDSKSKKLTNTKSGQVMSFEILLVLPMFERVALPFIQNLKRLGIDASVRTVDSAQYKKRTDDFDFDMIVGGWGQSDSPGNEQRDYWGSESADRAGGRNSSGVKNPVLDELIDLVIAAPDRKSLVNRIQALDAVLQWQHLIIPHWHTPYDRLVYWNRFSQPAVTPDQGTQFSAWWIDPEKDKKLSQYRRKKSN
ncbi:MAG: ABC transporter substrate-binding protein [Alphaproteobacteria bacterium]|nr:ABC transporter substrate-binding protein [Alphaproteobacteria bacterium]